MESLTQKGKQQKVEGLGPIGRRLTSVYETGVPSPAPRERL